MTDSQVSADASPSAGLLAGKRGLIMGVANERSIAWGVAQACAAQGADLAFTYQNEAFEKRVVPLAETLGSSIALPCDVASDDDLAAAIDQLGTRWPKLDFILHAVAFSDKTELKGRYADTSRDNFLRTLDISCFSFTNVSKRALPLMGEGSSLLTLTYLGSQRTTPNYNVMGVAKAALEASVRYLAVDLGGDGIRVNALSAGPMRTLAGSAIADARYTYRFTENAAPLQRNPDLREVGNAALYLLSDLSSGVTGEVHHIDCGFRAIGIPRPDTTSGGS